MKMVGNGGGLEMCGCELRGGLGDVDNWRDRVIVGGEDGLDGKVEEDEEIRGRRG